MTEYDNRLSGVLFKNDRKDKESQPDYKGSYTDEDNRNYWLSAWINKDQGGKPYMSIKATRKEGKPQEAPKAPPQAAEPGDTFPGSSIPF